GEWTPFPISGTVVGNRLSGTLTAFTDGGGTVDFDWTMADAGYFVGAFGSDPWCGVLSGALPAGCGWSGSWNVDMDGGGALAVVPLTQTADRVSGYVSDGFPSAGWNGTVSDWRLDGYVSFGCLICIVPSVYQFSWWQPNDDNQTFVGNVG